MKRPAKNKGKEKPLMAMDDLERTRAWDDIFEDVEVGLLDEARAGREKVMVAVAVLTLPDGQERIAYESDEAGDGEGSAPVSHVVARAKSRLRAKESIRFEMVDAFVTEDGTWRCAVRNERAYPQKRWEDILTSRRILERLEQARHEVSKVIHVSVALLKLAGGDLRVACADSERGDGEARGEMSTFVRRVKRTKRLRDGEELTRHLLKLTLSDAGWVATSVHDPSPTDRKAMKRPRTRGAHL
jgi:hypothetical protein